MKKIKYAICAASILTCMSCVNLDINPLSEGSSDNWYSTQEEIEMSVNDFYRTAFFPVYHFRWEDDLISRHYTSPVETSTITAENSDIKGLWQNYYKGIARALRIINKMDDARAMGVPEDKVKQYEGEAYFYLGYAYGYLAFHWGDAILDKTGMTLDEAYAAKRSPKADVLAYSYECFDKAAERLPLSYGGVQRATKGAALAFKARIALYNGDYSIAATAAKACMDLNVYKLHDNYQKLFTDAYSNELIFWLRGDVSLKVYYHPGNAPYNFLPRTVGGYGGSESEPSYELVCAYPCIDGKPIDESPLYNPKDFFENRDPRLAMTVIPFATAHNKKILDGTYDPNDYMFLGVEHSPSPLKLTVKKADGSVISNTDSKARAEHAGYNGLLFKKFFSDTWLQNMNGMATNSIYMRYGDVLLMYAEAMNELGQCTQDVLDASINKVRERAYNGTGIPYPAVLAGSQAQLRTIIRTERFIEMAFEGHRYPDLIRWRIAEKRYNTPIYYLSRAWSGSASWDGDESKVSDAYKQLIQNWREGSYPIGGIPEIDENGIADLSEMVEKGYIVVAAERKFDKDRDYLWPVPAADRLINPNLDQNPGY